MFLKESENNDVYLLSTLQDPD